MRFHAAFRASHHLGSLADVKLLPITQQKGLTFLTYLLEAQREVLEFELGVLEDVLKMIKSAASPRPTPGS